MDKEKLSKEEKEALKYAKARKAWEDLCQELAQTISPASSAQDIRSDGAVYRSGIGRDEKICMVLCFEDAAAVQRLNRKAEESPSKNRTNKKAASLMVRTKGHIQESSKYQQETNVCPYQEPIRGQIMKKPYWKMCWSINEHRKDKRTGVISPVKGSRYFKALEKEGDGW